MFFKLTAIAGAISTVFGQITENSFISLGCAAAIIAVVFKAGDELRRIRDKLSEHDRKFDAVRSANQMDMDMLRAELRPRVVEQSPEVSPWEATANYRFRVLLMEDNKQDILLFRRMLGSHFEIDEAPSMAIGCKKLQTGTYDCVLLDLGLPDLSRETAVLKFLSRHPTALCIAMSGTEGMESAALKQGADAFMAKDSMMDPPYVQRMVKHAILRFKSRSQV